MDFNSVSAHGRRRLSLHSQRLKANLALGVLIGQNVEVLPNRSFLILAGGGAVGAPGGGLGHQHGRLWRYHISSWRSSFLHHVTDKLTYEDSKTRT